MNSGTIGGRSNPLDDQKLLESLLRTAKSSQSSLGRSMDDNLKYRKFGGSNAEIQPSAMSMNRRARERELEAQQQQQRAWGAATARALSIATLPTQAPSFTKAADDGVEAFGGTKLGGAGCTTLVGMVPTEDTVRCIEDNFELISSFRPYRYDAVSAARQAAARDTAAPHPDLLRQLEPTLNGVQPHELVDTTALPPELFERCRALTRLSSLATEEEERERERTTGAAGAADTAGRTGAHSGTYSFLAVNHRTKETTRLPGNRAAEVGQYHVRYSEVEPRVTHGYIAPKFPTKAEGEEGGAGGGGADDGSGERGPTALEYGRMQPALVYAPGENIKGSTVFLSVVPRGTASGTAAPDVMYWPYPDARSQARRVPNMVRMETEPTRRRRDPPVSGVPTGAYEVTTDITAGVRTAAVMGRTTGREAHWYGRPEDRSAGADDAFDVERALQVTRPVPKAAVLPPQCAPGTAPPGTAPPDTSVSVERNLAFPPTVMGDPRRIANTRSFAHVMTREERERARNVNAFGDGGGDEGYSPEYQLVEKRGRSALIRPGAPAHAPLHDPHPTELGEVPRLTLVKPSTQRAAHFGPGAERPDHLLPLHDLSYDAARGLRAIAPRVKGDPMVGSTVSRQQREARYNARGCGADKMYDPVDFPPRRPRSVPDFDTQVTKETQFTGHAIPSERYERKFPKAPGPGAYDLTFSQIERKEDIDYRRNQNENCDDEAKFAAKYGLALTR